MSAWLVKVFVTDTTIGFPNEVEHTLVVCAADLQAVDAPVRTYFRNADPDLQIARFQSVSYLADAVVNHSGSNVAAVPEVR